METAKDNLEIFDGSLPRERVKRSEPVATPALRQTACSGAVSYTHLMRARLKTRWRSARFFRTRKSLIIRQMKIGTSKIFGKITKLFRMQLSRFNNVFVYFANALLQCCAIPTEKFRIIILFRQKWIFYSNCVGSYGKLWYTVTVANTTDLGQRYGDCLLYTSDCHGARFLRIHSQGRHAGTGSFPNRYSGDFNCSVCADDSGRAEK